MRLSTGHRKWVYWSGSLLLATGILWLIFHYFFRGQGQFGETPHPLEVWWLRLHGACAMLALLVLGSLLPIHVRRGWHQRRNILAGSIVSAVALLLIASGYALYYYGGEEARPWISLFHWALGLGIPLLLVWHVWKGRRIKPVEHRHRPQIAAVESAWPEGIGRVPANSGMDRTKRRPGVSA